MEVIHFLYLLNKFLIPVERYNTAYSLFIVTLLNQQQPLLKSNKFKNL